VSDGNEDVSYHLKHLSSSDWNPQVVSGIAEASRILRDNSEIPVGLAWLNKRNCEETEEFVSIHSDMEWVALTTETDVKEPGYNISCPICFTIIIPYPSIPIGC